jgi:acetyl esterase/lipase
MIRPPLSHRTGLAALALVGLFVVGMTLSAGARAEEPVPAGKSFDVLERRNLAYRDPEPGELLPVWNLADVYTPKGARGFPVLLLVHGGAWVGGDKSLDFIPDVARGLARQGVGVVAPNYRLAPQFRHPAQVADVAKALAWAKKHAPEYGGRADRIFLAGHSAGGHLVSLLASDEAHLKREGLSGEDVRGVVAVSGVYQIADVTVRLLVKSSGARLNAALTANPFTPVFGSGEEVSRRASPLSHVRAGLPPFLILYAEDDLPTLGEMAERFAAALRVKGCEAQLGKIPRRDHLTILWLARDPEDRVARAVAEFVKKHARPAKK